MGEDLKGLLARRAELKARLEKQNVVVTEAREALNAAERACGALERELSDCEKAWMDGMAKS